MCEGTDNARNKQARILLETKDTSINNWAPKNKPASESGSISLGTDGVSFTYDINLSEYYYEASINAPLGKFVSIHEFKVVNDSWSKYLTSSIDSSAAITYTGQANNIGFYTQYYLQSGFTFTAVTEFPL